MNSRSSSPQSEDSQEVERYDGIDRYYIPVENCDKAAKFFFWGSAFFSIVTLFTNNIWISINHIPVILFVIFVSGNLIATLSLRFYLIPTAEQKRRKQLLSNAFNVSLTSEETRHYYNNAFTDPLKRLGANVMENSFFSKSICLEMAKFERMRTGLYVLIWLIAVLYRSTDLELIGLITQTVFSLEVAGRLISIEFLRSKNETIYDTLYNEFFHKVDLSTPKGMASILDAFVTYETAKAIAGIMLSRKIFYRLNKSLSEEWEAVKEKLDFK